MKNIVIIGSGGFAKEVAFLIDEINRDKPTWNILGFIDNNVSETNGKYKIFQNDEYLFNTTNELNVVFGIGNPALLEKLYLKFSKNKKLKFPNLIHPNVIGDWERINLGEGNIICASNTFTTDISLGNCNIINLDCTIGHDTAIGNFNVLNPSVNVSGGVKIGNKNLIGTNVTILQCLSIKNELIIGASALITKNILEKGTYIGAPVKKIK